MLAPTQCNDDCDDKAKAMNRCLRREKQDMIRYNTIQYDTIQYATKINKKKRKQDTRGNKREVINAVT